MLRTSKIRITDSKFKKFGIEKMFLTRHFENILLILLEQDYKQAIGDFKLISNAYVMRAVIRDTKGGSYADEVNYVKEKYKDNQLMQDLIKIGGQLKKDNLVMTIQKIKSEYKGFFTKIKKGDKSARPPKPKKLSSLNHYTLLIDNDKGMSIAYLMKGKNKLGITLDHDIGRQYIYVDYQAITKLVGGNLDNIQSINLHYSNGELYLLITYHKEVKDSTDIPLKIAGLDIGINNLASIYIDDQESSSLIIDGEPYKHYNSKFNRFVGQLTSAIDTIDNKNRIKYLKKFKSYIFEKRNRYYFDQFHKVSKRILEYLSRCNVTELVISENLNQLKNNGNCNLHKKTKQSFIQIPFGRLLKKLKYKSKEYGIKIIVIDEAYTSKSNSLTDDVYKVHSILDKIKRLKSSQSEDNKTHQEVKNLTNAYKKLLKVFNFQGKRVKRGLYHDELNNKIYNSDLNGAYNILKLSPDYRPTKKNINYEKLCNPIKVKNDYQLCKLIKRIV